MGDAYLMGSGGMRLRRLLALQPPVTMYLAGQTADMSGAVIAADFGRTRVILGPSGYTVSPDESLAVSDTALTVSADIGGVRKSVSIPITVYDAASPPDFSACSWETIAWAARQGIAGNLWSVGDVKSVTVGGVTRQYRIIGINHDQLAPCDSLYGDLQYNHSLGKAALTLMDCTGYEAYYHTSGGRPTHDCSLYGETLPGILETFPPELRSALRTVEKATSYNHPGTTNTVTDTRYDRLFVLSATEVFGDGYSGDSPPAAAEKNACSQYGYFAGHGHPAGAKAAMLRTVHNGCVNQDIWHIAAVTADGQGGDLSGANNVPYLVYPAFCI